MSGRLVLVRHGQSYGNVERRLDTRPPGSALTALGRDQALAFAQGSGRPAMLAHSADMAGYAGTLQSLGADIASEQAALQAGWQGDTGMSYQAWQAQWNQAMEQLVLAYRAMAGTHENNTTSMLARDSAEGAKWGG